VNTNIAINGENRERERERWNKVKQKWSHTQKLKIKVQKCLKFSCRFSFIFLCFFCFLWPSSAFLHLCDAIQLGILAQTSNNIMYICICRSTVACWLLRGLPKQRILYDEDNETSQKKMVLYINIYMNKEIYMHFQINCIYIYYICAFVVNIVYLRCFPRPRYPHTRSHTHQYTRSQQTMWIIHISFGREFYKAMNGSGPAASNNNNIELLNESE
jgi:hypothetical protein